jgi:O-antigen ligase
VALAIESLLVPALSAVEITDALLFAFVAGAAWPLARPIAGRPDRLARPAILLGAIIVSGLIVDLRIQHPSESLFSIVPALGRHFTTTYFLEPRTFPPLSMALRWLALLATAVLLERCIRGAPDKAGAITRLWLVGGAAAGSFALLRVAEVALTRRVDLDLWVSIVRLFQQYRFSALHPDLNAAGSYFAIFLTALIVLAVLHRRIWLLLAIGPPVLVAFTSARSRAAFGAVAVTVAGAFAIEHLRHGRWRLAVGTFLGCAVLAGGLTAVATSSTTHVDLRAAAAFRVEMLRVGLAIVSEHPVFGVGLGGFIAASRDHMTEDVPMLGATYPSGENAHNNYLQIAGELGLIALGAFLWMAAAVWLPGRGGAPPSSSAAEGHAIRGGLAAFLISALAGHPLLIPQVAAGFFVALGLAAGLAPPRAAGRAASWWAWGGATLAAASVLWRT